MMELGVQGLKLDIYTCLIPNKLTRGYERGQKPECCRRLLRVSLFKHPYQQLTYE